MNYREIDAALRYFFPARVWVSSGAGFYSRKATPADRKRRLALVQLLSTSTPTEEKADIRSTLTPP